MLELVRTCEACPEQYDVYENNKLVAYIRLRWGHLTVNLYDGNQISDYILYEKTYSDKFKGIFDNEDERQKELDIILSIIRNYLVLKY